MQTQAPSIGRILVAIGFALSCFGLILFLWIAFGGPIPLAPKSYEITAYFPEATQLAQEADVRVGGVSVGKVKSIELAPADKRVDGQDTTQATIEIEPQFAPINSDAKAILRQKTLLGETYIELTSGSEPGSEGGSVSEPVSLGSDGNATDAQTASIQPIPEGGQLASTQVQDATQIDEIFNALDEQTREAFQQWQANAAVAVQGRGLDINDAIGNLGPFISNASGVLTTLEQQKASLKGLVRDTGTVFDALSARDGELASVITNSNQVFAALAAQNQALADTFQILPTFERESALTFNRLDQFQALTSPLIKDLIPVAEDLTPTVHSVRLLSPPLTSLFGSLDQLVDVSKTGLPALKSTLDGAAPVLDQLDPFLANLNPVIDYLYYQRQTVTDFLTGPGTATAATLPTIPGQHAARHYLRQGGYLSAESLAIHQVRLNANRGNGYLKALELTAPYSARSGIPPSFDCKNTDYTPLTTPGSPETMDEEQYTINDQPPVSPAFAPCVITPDSPAQFGGGRAPTIFADP